MKNETRQTLMGIVLHCAAGPALFCGAILVVVVAYWLFGGQPSSLGKQLEFVLGIVMSFLFLAVFRSLIGITFYLLAR